MTIHEIAEQEAVFDGAPRPYVDAAALLLLLNHRAYGSLGEARQDGIRDPRRHVVRVRIEYEELAP